jgi:hypothetical protein
MSQIISKSRSRRRRTPMVAAALLAVLASVVLAACGGSSSSPTGSTASASTSASTSTSTSTSPSASTSTPGKAAGAGASRFAALRECLQKNGITLPERKPGKRPSGGAGGFLGGGGFTLPKGVTKAQYEAAIKKCGGFAGGRVGGGRVGGSVFTSPAAKQALTKFATCMREHGVNVPTPNTSGKGPIFDIRGLNTNSAAFKAAESKCSGALRGAFRAHPGAADGQPGGPGSAGPGGSAPPTSAG